MQSFSKFNVKKCSGWTIDDNTVFHLRFNPAYADWKKCCWKVHDLASLSYPCSMLQSFRFNAGYRIPGWCTDNLAETCMGRRCEKLRAKPAVHPWRILMLMYMQQTNTVLKSKKKLKKNRPAKTLHVSWTSVLFSILVPSLKHLPKHL